MHEASVKATVWKRGGVHIALGALLTLLTLLGSSSADAQTCTTPPDKVVIAYSGPGCPEACAEDTALQFNTQTSSGYSLQACDSVNWNFGDGTTSTERNPAKSFSTPGAYPVILTTSNHAGSHEIRGVIVVSAFVPNCNAPTGAGFMYSGTTTLCDGGSNCAQGEKLTFVGWTTTVQNCDTFTWTWGDGTPTTTGRTVDHTFAVAGLYNVKLSVTNPNGGKSDFTYPVHITTTGADQMPSVVDFSLSKTRPIVNTAITATGTSDVAGTTFEWNFGDATAVQKGTTVNHTFTKTGNFNVTMKACNGRFCTALVSKGVQVVTPNEFSFLLPAVAHLENRNGAGEIVDRWKTDVHIYNPDPDFDATVPLELEFEFLGQTKTILVDRSTVVYQDFLPMLANLNTFGAVVVRGNSPYVPRIWTRTYVDAADGSGTYGQLIPAVPVAGTGANAEEGESTHFLAGLTSDARSRTNIGLVNSTDASANFVITVRDEDGFPLAPSFTIPVDKFALRQINDSEMRTRVPDLPANKTYSIEVNRPDGRPVVAYASLVDRVSSDPVYIESISEAEAKTAGRVEQLVPGASHFVPNDGSAWKSDLSIFNADSGPIRVDLQVLSPSGVKVAEARNITLGAKASIQVKDVLTAPILAPVVDLATATLKVVTTTSGVTRFPIIYGRTYNDHGDLGTFGQGISGFSKSEANLQPGKDALLAGVMTDDLYYTNLGLLSLSNEPTTVFVSLLSRTTGDIIGGPTQFTLAPGESKIIGSASADFLRSLNPTEEVGTLRLQVQSGGDVWAFASIIDRLTRDPEYVPASK